MADRREYSITVTRDGKFYFGYCLEVQQARGQGETKAAAIEDTKLAIKLCRTYLKTKKNTSRS
jgi:predicted RNase H-like HicB family nuclease